MNEDEAGEDIRLLDLIDDLLIKAGEVLALDDDLRGLIEDVGVLCEDTFGLDLLLHPIAGIARSIEHAARMVEGVGRQDGRLVA